MHNGKGMRFQTALEECTENEYHSPNSHGVQFQMVFFDHRVQWKVVTFLDASKDLLMVSTDFFVCGWSWWTT